MLDRRTAAGRRGSALRGANADYVVLCATTVVMAVGIAIMQPIMPTAVRQWLPERIGFGTAMYTNGLLFGEIFPVLLTIPFVLPLVGESWRLALVTWSTPVAIVAVLIYVAAPSTAAAAGSPCERRAPRCSCTATAPTGGVASAQTRAKWTPDWHEGLVWRLGLLFLCITGSISAPTPSSRFFSKQGPARSHRPRVDGAQLRALPASLLLLVVAGRLERRAVAYIASATLSLI